MERARISIDPYDLRELQQLLRDNAAARWFCEFVTCQECESGLVLSGAEPTAGTDGITIYVINARCERCKIDYEVNVPAVVRPRYERSASYHLPIDKSVVAELCAAPSGESVRSGARCPQCADIHETAAIAESAGTEVRDGRTFFKYTVYTHCQHCGVSGSTDGRFEIEES